MQLLLVPMPPLLSVLFALSSSIESSRDFSHMFTSVYDFPRCPRVHQVTT